MGTSLRSHYAWCLRRCACASVRRGRFIAPIADSLAPWLVQFQGVWSHFSARGIAGIGGAYRLRSSGRINHWSRTTSPPRIYSALATLYEWNSLEEQCSGWCEKHGEVDYAVSSHCERERKGCKTLAFY